MNVSSISDLEGKEHRLRIPLRDADVPMLELGDVVYLDGEIFAGRALFSSTFMSLRRTSSRP